jgi:hypothetical protein
VSDCEEVHIGRQHHGSEFRQLRWRKNPKAESQIRYFARSILKLMMVSIVVRFSLGVYLQGDRMVRWMKGCLAHPCLIDPFVISEHFQRKQNIVTITWPPMSTCRGAEHEIHPERIQVFLECRIVR